MRQNKTKSVAKTVAYLSHFARDSKRDVFLTWLFVGIESFCEILVTYFMQFLLNAVQQSGGVENGLREIVKYASIIAGFVLVAAATGIMAGYFSSSAAAGFGRNLREEMFVKIQGYSFENIDKFSTSSIVTRTTTDVTNVQNAFLMIIRAVVRSPFMMVFALIMAFVTNWKMGFIYVAIIPVTFSALIAIASKAHPIFVSIFEKYDELNETVQENVDGIRVVKSFNMEEHEKKTFGKISEFIYRNFTKAEKLLAFNAPSMNLAIYAATIAIAVIASNIIVYSGGTELMVGSLSTMITYLMQIMMSLMMLSMVYVQIIIARNSAERIVEVIDEKPTIASPENAITAIEDGEVVFDDVSFAYVEGKNVLKHINLSVPSGSTVGIIGSTGSSKTTLVSLLARLYDVSEGSVKVGGHDVREYDLTSLRDSVAVVLQKNVLFTGTIRQNLLWGNEHASEEEIKEACDIAQASEFLARFKEGLETKIVEGGSNVSGGQKQRLCIARALLKNPKILILDDSTSACDTHTDSLIRKGLRNSKPNVTKFIIAQRVLSIQDCDIIIVMDHGEIVAKGTDKELKNSCEIYKQLVVSQLGGDFDAAN